MLPRKPVTMVAKEAMATVETLKGEDMLRLIFRILRCFIASFLFEEDRSLSAAKLAVQ